MYIFFFRFLSIVGYKIWNMVHCDTQWDLTIRMFVFFLRFIYLKFEYNCFIILCWFLPYINESAWGFPGGSHGRNLPAMQETHIQSLGREHRLEKGMATHSSILAREFHGQRSLEGTVHGVAKSWTQLKD